MFKEELKTVTKKPGIFKKLLFLVAIGGLNRIEGEKKNREYQQKFLNKEFSVLKNE